tara:strand:- start:1974 stop:2786 length:813 start_codon:yes stop_codon:yes gene_type:complete
MVPSIKDLEDKYKGKAGFVIGSGPSIAEQDVTPLRDYVTISVNSGLVKMPDCDFFLSDDVGVKNWSYYLFDLPQTKCLKLLYIDKLQEYCHHLNPEEVIFFRHKWWHDPRNKKFNPVGLTLTKGYNEPIIGARSSAASALHFLYIMGCDPIVLLGTDCSLSNVYDEGILRRYFYQYWPKEMQPYRITGESVFCAPNRGIKDDFYVDSHSMEFLDYWHLLAKQVDKQSINVINASGGILEYFPRMKLEEVLDEYGDRKKEKDYASETKQAN